MNTSQYTNIAFISYKREDEEWAKWLQKKLEHYKLPTEIRKQNPDLEFAKNPRHVFKDTTDLSGGVLAKAIKEGLDSSKFLIVICSPRAAKSEWVCKEVQDFIDSGREEYIIPFIIDGEPYAKDIDKECFPEALKSLAGERELLGININENGRESAAVKIVSRIFDLRFDTLWNRFQREKNKHIQKIIVGLVISIFLIMGIASWIGWQNIQISGANVKLFENKAKSVSHIAREQISEGNVLQSIVALLEVLPEDIEEKDIPYVGDAEVALRVAVDSLYSSHSWKNHDLNSLYGYLTPKGKYIILPSYDGSSDEGILEIINTDNFSTVGQVKLRIFDSSCPIYCSRVDDKIAVLGEKEMYIYSLPKLNLIKKDYSDKKYLSFLKGFERIDTECYGVDNLFPRLRNENFHIADYCPNNNLLIGYSSSYKSKEGVFTIKVFDVANETYIWERTINYSGEYWDLSSCLQFSPLGHKFGYVTEYGTIHVFDTQTYNETIISELGDPDIALLTHKFIFSKSEDKIYYSSELSNIVCYDITNRKIINRFGKERISRPNISDNEQHSMIIHDGLIRYKKTSPLYFQYGNSEWIMYYDSYEMEDKHDIYYEGKQHVVNGTYEHNFPSEDSIKLKDFTIVYDERVIRCVDNKSKVEKWVFTNSDDYITYSQPCFDNKYIFIVTHMRGRDVTRYLVNINSGKIVNKWKNKEVYYDEKNIYVIDNEYGEYSNLYVQKFPTYSELLQLCKKLTAGLKLDKYSRKKFNLD